MDLSIARARQIVAGINERLDHQDQLEDSRFEWLAKALGAVTAYTAASQKAANAASRVADSLTLTRGTAAEPSTEQKQQTPHLKAVPDLPPTGELSDDFMEEMSRSATERALARNGPGSAERFTWSTRGRQ